MSDRHLRARIRDICTYTVDLLSYDGPWPSVDGAPHPDRHRLLMTAICEIDAIIVVMDMRPILEEGSSP